MKRMHWLAALAALALITPVAVAQRKVDPQPVSGSKVAERTTLVGQAIDWKGSLEEAKKEAAEKHKMIFWMQIVGDLQGGL